MPFESVLTVEIVTSKGTAMTTTAQEMLEARKLEQSINSNHETLFVISVADFQRLYQDSLGKELVAVGRTAGGYASTILDIATLSRAVQELGFTGRAYEKTVNGTRYLVFKGNPAKRTLFTGVRYLASNAKVVDMAIGKAGINASIRSGARLTIFLTVPMIVIEHLLKDRVLLSEMLADIGVSLVKVGISSVVAAVAATAVGNVTTVAVAPLAVAIFVGLLVGYVLDKADQKFGITSKLAQALREMEDATLGEVRLGLWEIERTLRWQIMNGQQVGKGIFYP